MLRRHRLFDRRYPLYFLIDVAADPANAYTAVQAPGQVFEAGGAVVCDAFFRPVEFRACHNAGLRNNPSWRNSVKRHTTLFIVMLVGIARPAVGGRSCTISRSPEADQQDHRRGVDRLPRAPESGSPGSPTHKSLELIGENAKGWGDRRPGQRRGIRDPRRAICLPAVLVDSRRPSVSTARSGSSSWPDQYLPEQVVLMLTVATAGKALWTGM